jgi:ABC-type transporter Mla maintaining outer membrane lipid asymmetry ATPase subunit MlaF
MPEADPVLRIEGVIKSYQGLRPLRLASLALTRGERVTILGLDAPAAEVTVNLVTGAALPDRGDVWIFGRRTTDIATADDWLAWLDHFGIVSERGVLLEASTLQQNLAMPFTLEIDPVPPDVAQRVVTLARECGLSEDMLQIRIAELPPEARLRAHLARAVALSPQLLVLEHPTGRVPERARKSLAADVARVCESLGLSALIITNDEAFAQRVASRNLRLDAATGELRLVRRRWFGR